MRLKFDVSHVRIGEACKVYMSVSGWTKATVIQKHSTSITVKLVSGRYVTVFDSRNVKK
jgi:sRNA-binding protein|tara:strand:+ start:306 stop:482 length:177 start_codon:yes stop_codon:yes gene_type:complete